MRQLMIPLVPSYGCPAIGAHNTTSICCSPVAQLPHLAPAGHRTWHAGARQLFPGRQSNKESMVLMTEHKWQRLSSEHRHNIGTVSIVSMSSQALGLCLISANSKGNLAGALDAGTPPVLWMQVHLRLPNLSLGHLKRLLLSSLSAHILGLQFSKGVVHLSLQRIHLGPRLHPELVYGCSQPVHGCPWLWPWTI